MQHNLKQPGKAPEAVLPAKVMQKRGLGVWKAELKAMGALAHMQIPNVGMLCDDFMKYKSQMNFS